MSTEVKKEIQLEIAHVLFSDIVGYSKLMINEQRALRGTLTEIVRRTEEFQSADAAGKLIKIPTGDGMALVFQSSPEAPVECALEISRALKAHPNLPLRMGVHSGPVSGVIDVNGQASVAGAGINMAQRVMDCGDAGHIILSKRVADDLEQYPHWRPLLHDLGEREVKHGVHLAVFNLYTEELGNPDLPEKFKRPVEQEKTSVPISTAAGKEPRPKWGLIGATVLTIGALAGGALLWSHRDGSIPGGGTAPSIATAPVAAGVPAAPEKSVAVLPFENLSDDKQNAYFTDGVQDEILTDLAKIADLKVISRSSVMQYKTDAKRNLREIGQQLGVAHLLEGSVQRAGGKVRVNAQLIDARTDAHLWAQTYDRELADVFAIQSEIARAIADQLQAELSPQEKTATEKPPTTDLVAYEFYLRAKRVFNTPAFTGAQKGDLFLQTAQQLNQAVARDPHFVLAWCLLSETHSNIYVGGFDRTRDRLDLAYAAAQDALRLQPKAGEAHLALAIYYYSGLRDYERARHELDIARLTLPNNGEVFAYTGYIDRRQGQWEAATRNLERAVELDPRNDQTIDDLATTYGLQRRYADQFRMFDRMLTILPGNPYARISRANVAFDWRADIRPRQAMLAALIDENRNTTVDFDHPGFALCERTATAAARALANYPRDGVLLSGVNFPHSFWEGEVAHWEGNAVKAQTAFTAARTEVLKTVEAQPDSPVALSLLGIIDAYLGRKEEALRVGRRACELAPISKDAVGGPDCVLNLAETYTALGEKDLAIEQIAAAARVPSNLSYGLIKLDPTWDPLRGDPRFEKIVASLAPKE